MGTGSYLANLNSFPQETKQTSVVKRELNEYLLNGSFPELHKFGKNIVVRIYSDIIEKVIRRYPYHQKLY